MIKIFLQRLQKIFDIDNPLLIVSFLVIIIFSRFVATYFNDTHQVLAPDVNYYAGKSVGHDLVFATTDQAYRMLRGIPMQLGVGYGYTFTILTAWIITLFNNVGICSPSNHVLCQFLFYKVIVSLSLFGLLSLPFLLIKNHTRQAIAVIFLMAFLLGVPGGMGIESGNLDIILSVFYGFMIFLQKVSLKNKKEFVYPLLLGILSGAVLQTKIFVLPIVIIFLICSTNPLIFTLSFLTIFSFITLIPGLYHVPTNPLFALQAAQTLRSVADFSNEIVYGNNDTRAMVGGIISGVPAFRTNQIMREILVNIGGGFLFLSVLILPVFRFVRKILKRFRNTSLADRLDFPFFIAFNCYAVTAIILWPEISLSYRFYYLLPLIFVLLDTSQTKLAKQSLGIALSALLIRSTFIWHARILHLPLLLFFYFILLTSLSTWIDSSKLSKGARKPLFIE